MTALGRAVLGALIAGRRPGNPIGWLMVASSVFLGVYSFTQQYAPLAAREGLPGLGLASWLATWTRASLWLRPAREGARAPGPGNDTEL